MVFEVRDLWPELPIALGFKGPLVPAARFLEWIAYRSSTRVVALSPGMREGVLQRGYPADRVAVIPNSADIELFDVPPARGQELRASLDWLGDRPLIVYAGTLGPANDTGYLVRLAKALEAVDPEIRFLFIGAGKERAEVEALAESLGVKDRSVHFNDGVPKAEMPTYLSAATFCATTLVDHPALCHSSPNKVFDAFAASRPVMMNYRGWLADLLQEHDAGLVLPARDPEAAASTVAARIRDSAWLARAGAAGRHLAQTRFDRNLLARELERVLVQASGTAG
jgi:glycosyltransferase involved in cell wall biosynthesis